MKIIFDKDEVAKQPCDVINPYRSTPRVLEYQMAQQLKEIGEFVGADIIEFKACEVGNAYRIVKGDKVLWLLPFVFEVEEFDDDIVPEGDIPLHSPFEPVGLNHVIFDKEDEAAQIKLYDEFSPGIPHIEAGPVTKFEDGGSCYSCKKVFDDTYYQVRGKGKFCGSCYDEGADVFFNKDKKEGE